MSKQELEDKVNNYKIKLNMVNFKLDGLNSMIETFDKKEENVKRFIHRNLYKFSFIILVGMLSLLSHIWFISAIIYASACPFLVKAISSSSALSKIKKFKKYLNSKHFNLAFAKFVFTTNKSKVQDLLKTLETEETQTKVKTIKKQIYTTTNVDEIDEIKL